MVTIRDCNDYKDPQQRSSCQLADDSAERAVYKAFSILGVDVNNPCEVKEFQQDLRFGATLRKAADRGVLSIVSAVAILLVGAIAFAFKAKTGGG